MANPSYQVLCERFGGAARLYAAKISLFWDSQTGMPSTAAWSRGEQFGALDAARRDLIVAPDVDDLLADAEAHRRTLDELEVANLREMRRIVRHESAVPKALVLAKARLVAKTLAAWVVSKRDNVFEPFAETFAGLLPIHREIAAAKSATLGLAPYDALMDEADPGLSIDIVEPVFADLEADLPALLAEVTERQARQPAPLPFVGDFSASRQQALCHALALTVGLDPASLRIDPAPHPFTLVGSPGDNRITIRIDPRNVRVAVMAVLHESGHALYESRLPRASAFQPVGAPRGATTHESQALMVEMQASRSAEFLAWLAPQFEAAFGGDAACWSVPNVLRTYRRIDAGHVRIEADEISYPLHVILRYRIEQALLSGDLAVADLPVAWADLSRSLLGRKPPTHAVGCLQDIHWAVGLFGYFPNYALGAALAAQLFDAAVRENSAILANLRAGDFSAYRAWTSSRVHARASEVPFTELVMEATGSPLSGECLKRHLRQRYIELT